MILVMPQRVSDEIYKREVAERLAAAAPLLNMSALSRELKISPQALMQFTSTYRMNIDKLRVLDELLSNLAGKEEAKADADIDTVTCPSCHSKVPSRYQHTKFAYCGVCGELFLVECSYCSTLNDGDADFCKKCGRPLHEGAEETAAKAQEAMRVAMLSNAERTDEVKKKGKRKGEPEL